MKGIEREFSSGDMLLRPIAATDLEHIYEGLSHPDVIRYYGVSYKTLNDAQAQMDWYSKLVREGSGIWWAICSGDNLSFYGACGFNNLSAVHRKAEIGFWLIPQYWGRGIITSAVTLICNHAFINMGLHRIEAWVESGNEKSKSVMRKLGFTLEGTMLDAEVKDERFINLHIYALLNK